MFFNIALIIAATIFLIGLELKVVRWITVDPVPGKRVPDRGKAALKGVFGAVFGKRFPALVKTFILDVVLQVKTLRQSFFRWSMHMFIWVGFTLLVLFHAMDGLISEALLPGYVSTLNPYLFLRDLLAVLIIAGVVMAVVRRKRFRQPRLRSGRRDWTALAILTVILITGLLLAGMKITSVRAFDRMVEEYAILEQEEVQDLEAYWAAEYGLKASDIALPVAADAYDRGAEFNEYYCISCHSKPQTAPLSYGAAMVLGPVAGTLDKAGFAALLWYLHFLAAFAGLAYLPFSKFFHIIATPVHLLARAGAGDKPHPATAANIRALSLDACMHCGACSEICAVGAAYELIPNDIILPSEKIDLLLSLHDGDGLGYEGWRTAIQGMVLCTNCNRCGEACPAGIDLQPMWAAVREGLLDHDADEAILLSGFSFYRACIRNEIGEKAYAAPRDRAWRAIRQIFGEATEVLDLSARDNEMRERIKSGPQGFSFSRCYSCKTCSSACPVKDQYADPYQELDLLPHQIIHATLLGQTDLVSRSRMLWACLGCYQCQEQCPQDVRVTDVLYELKNMAMRRTGLKGLT
jgi:heterodisulfide reductase subunit C/nitrate reductase gamma subunit